MPLELVVAASLLAAASGLPALALPRRSPWAQRASVLLIVLASAAGLAGAFAGLFSVPSDALILPWPAIGDSFIGLDSLSSFFLVPVFLVGGLGAVYGLGYSPAAGNPRTGRRLAVFYGLLVAGMALLLLARGAFAFLLGWETMALSGFFLIGLEDQKNESRSSSFVYLVAAHLSTLVLFGMFLLWRAATGSFDLERSGAAAMSLGVAGGIFLLALLGFGLKAGIMPLHFWLPGAHAAAPSHVSALLSGVVLKMGVYGILRMLSLLPGIPAAWGALVLVLGATSALFGVVFALAQHDLKKLLAYHSVENIGIILMGLGIALLGRSAGMSELFVLGFAACLLHVWNHSLFKSLLFLGAGSVVRATGTRAIDRLGGLGKTMPWTAALFIVGAVAICGLPPLNGFVSELLVYLGLFGGLARDGAGLALAAMAAPVLAMVGALAVACFVKVVGAAFLGSARSREAEEATESPASMIVPIGALAALCALIGLAPRLLVPVLDSAIACWNGTGTGVPSLAGLAPLDQAGLAAMALVVMAGIAAFLFSRGIRARGEAKVSRGIRARGEAKAPLRPTWDCGYAAPTSRMQYTSSSFARGIVGMFSWFLRPSPEPRRIQGYFPEAETLHSEVDEAILDRVLRPALRLLERLSTWFHRFQQGLAQQYLLYMLLALIVLICTLVPAGGLLGLAKSAAGGAAGASP
jgi:hydrogenase-4 component B